VAGDTLASSIELPHIGLRLQYRGNIYSAPNVTTFFSSTGTFKHTAEPMIGADFKFR